MSARGPVSAHTPTPSSSGASPDTALRRLREWLALGEPACALLGPAGIGKVALFSALDNEVRAKYQVARLQRPASSKELCITALQDLAYSISERPEAQLLELAEGSLDTHEGVLLLLDDPSALPPAEAAHLLELCEHSRGCLRLAFAADSRSVSSELLAAFGHGLVRIDLGPPTGESDSPLPAAGARKPAASRGSRTATRLGPDSDRLTPLRRRAAPLRSGATSPQRTLGHLRGALSGLLDRGPDWLHGGAERVAHFAVQVASTCAHALRALGQLGFAVAGLLVALVTRAADAKEPAWLRDTRRGYGPRLGRLYDRVLGEIQKPDARRAPARRSRTRTEEPDLAESVLQQIRDWASLGEPSLALVAPSDVAKPLLLKRFAREAQDSSPASTPPRSVSSPCSASARSRARTRRQGCSRSRTARSSRARGCCS
jgi:hypothetical protein